MLPVHSCRRLAGVCKVLRSLNVVACWAPQDHQGSGMSSIQVAQGVLLQLTSLPRALYLAPSCPRGSAQHATNAPWVKKAPEQERPWPCASSQAVAAPMHGAVCKARDAGRGSCCSIPTTPLLEGQGSCCPDTLAWSRIVPKKVFCIGGACSRPFSDQPHDCFQRRVLPVQRTSCWLERGPLNLIL